MGRKTKKPKKPSPKLRMAGVELYFDDLTRAKDFCCHTLGIDIRDGGRWGIRSIQCRLGLRLPRTQSSENYPLQDKPYCFLK